MHIAITGAYGQLGTELQHALKGTITPLGRDRLDISEATDVNTVLANLNPDLVINTAAYNLVDRAEEEPAAAILGNATGPKNLALFCESRKIPLLHFSSDYVFSGWETNNEQKTPHTTPYLETDTPDTLSAYASSKLEGEQLVSMLCSRHFVVRTCGLYGTTKQPGTGNFVETMLRLGAERDELGIVNDQRCTPTSCTDLAKAVAALIETEAWGLYHATNAGNMTWYEFAIEIFRQADISINVKPITSEKFGAKATRPTYSVLDNSKLTSIINTELPPWQDALTRYLEQRQSGHRN